MPRSRTSAAWGWSASQLHHAACKGVLSAHDEDGGDHAKGSGARLVLLKHPVKERLIPGGVKRRVVAAVLNGPEVG